MNKFSIEGGILHSLLIKGSILAMGLVLVLWLGWTVPTLQETNSPSPDRDTVHHLIQKGSPREIGNQNPVTKEFRATHRATLNINKGSAQELEVLPGIGPILAARIVARRKTVGEFRYKEDLLSIKGIGERRLARILPHIDVQR
jgi:competence protein ComEA